MPDTDATGAGGHVTSGAAGGGVAGVLGLGGHNGSGAMAGFTGEGGSAGSAGASGGGGSADQAGAGGNSGGSGGPAEAGRRDAEGDAAADAVAKDASSTDAAIDGAADARLDAGPDAVLTDASARDAEASVADAKFDACVPAGPEICDGLDNNCNGSVDEQSACPDGCIGITRLGKGYMLCYAPARRAAWSDAQADCVSRGMHLVRVDDAGENQWIVDATAGVGYGGGLWIGATDRQTDGVWVWTDGVQFWHGQGDTGGPVGGLYNGWGAGQPNNNADGGEACGELDANGSWNDLGCDTFVIGYVCER